MRTQEFDVHITDMLNFKNCRRDWDFKSHMRGNLTSNKPYMPFLIGTAVHHCFEQRTLNNIRMLANGLVYFTTKWTRELYNQLGSESINDILNWLNHYELWQSRNKTVFADSQFEFLAPEYEFKTVLYRNTRRVINLAGKFDNIVRHIPTGDLYVWEYKTTRSIAERESTLHTDEQASAYVWAAHRLGFNVKGVIYTLIAKKSPALPEVRKDGFLSKAQVSTTTHYYLDCIKAHHGAIATPEFIREHYSGILNNLLANTDQFFKRIIVTRNLSALNEFHREAQQVALEMTKSPLIYPTRSYHCKYCMFKAPCELITMGDSRNALLALQDHYTRNTRFDIALED